MLGVRSSQTVQNLLITAVSLFLAFVAIEGYLRVTAYYPLVIKPPYLFDNHPRTGWTLRSNFRATVEIPEGPITYSINSQGIRAASDFSASTNFAHQHIFLIGDSFTFGEGVAEEFTFSKLLNNSMKDKYSEIEFINLGVPGFGTMHSYERLLEYSDLFGIPNGIIYIFCTNDPVDNLAKKREVVNGILMDSDRKNKVLLSYIARMYNNSRFIAFLLDTYYNNFNNPRKLKRQELKKQMVSVQEQEDFIATTKYLSKVISWVKENRVNFFVVTTSYSEYSEPLRAMLLDEQIPLIEADDIFSELNVDNKPTVLSDGHHWNRLGHRLIAKGIEEFLYEQQWISHGQASP